MTSPNWFCTRIQSPMTKALALLDRSVPSRQSRSSLVAMTRATAIAVIDSANSCSWCSHKERTTATISAMLAWWIVDMRRRWSGERMSVERRIQTMPAWRRPTMPVTASNVNSARFAATQSNSPSIASVPRHRNARSPFARHVPDGGAEHTVPDAGATGTATGRRAAVGGGASPGLACALAGTASAGLRASRPSRSLPARPARARCRTSPARARRAGHGRPRCRGSPPRSDPPSGP